MFVDKNLYKDNWTNCFFSKHNFILLLKIILSTLPLILLIPLIQNISWCLGNVIQSFETNHGFSFTVEIPWDRLIPDLSNNAFFKFIYDFEALFWIISLFAFRLILGRKNFYWYLLFYLIEIAIVFIFYCVCPVYEPFQGDHDVFGKYCEFPSSHITIAYTLTFFIRFKASSKKTTNMKYIYSIITFIYCLILIPTIWLTKHHFIMDAFASIVLVEILFWIFHIFLKHKHIIIAYTSTNIERRFISWCGLIKLAQIDKTYTRTYTILHDKTLYKKYFYVSLTLYILFCCIILLGYIGMYIGFIKQVINNIY
jgi:hypothetical protein